MNETVWLWIGTLGMAAGSVVLFVAAGARTRDEEGHRLTHGLVPLVAALAYFAMAVGQGALTLPSGRVVLFARYVDWSVTTPLLLIALSITALGSLSRRPFLVAGLLISDVMMIVTGLFFALSDQATAKWTWYIASCGAFLAVYSVLMGSLKAEAEASGASRGTVYSRNLSILGVLWLIYPIVVLLGPDGLGIWSAVLTTACITILDLLAKVGYGLIAMSGSKTITNEDLAERTVATGPIPVATSSLGR